MQRIIAIILNFIFKIKWKCNTCGETISSRNIKTVESFFDKHIGLHNV